jgi:hypothetical protein
VLAVILGSAEQLAAHQGPPFPIAMDQPLGNYIVSVWADPDVGEATFYIAIESPKGVVDLSVPSVQMWVEPVSGRLKRVMYDAERQTLRNRTQFEVRPIFDDLDLWNIGFRIAGAGQVPQELTLQIESTPPGFGPWDLAIYLFPFVLFGGLWVMGMVRRYRQQHATHKRVATNTKKSYSI